MPQTALYELAEATLGLAPEMHWSVDEEIARRESARLFERVWEHTTTPEAALAVFLLTMQAKLENSMSVLEDRYNRVVASLNHEQQSKCPSLNEFFEFFTGLTSVSNYASNMDIARTELGPLFAALGSHTITAAQCQDAVFDNVNAKKELALVTLQKAVQCLKVEMDALVTTKAESDGQAP